MSRWVSLAVITVWPAVCVGEDKTQPKQQQKAEQQEQAPPEEDEAIARPKEYAFNPLQASKELQVGNFYFKKGSYRAAALRFREATNWNNGLAEAWLRLAEAEEKLENLKPAREAYEKYVELAPEEKRAKEIRKKLEKLPKEQAPSR
jgi:tetratricopeptide (TPR) repeat protein